MAHMLRLFLGQLPKPAECGLEPTDSDRCGLLDDLTLTLGPNASSLGLGAWQCQNADQVERFFKTPWEKVQMLDFWLLLLFCRGWNKTFLPLSLSLMLPPPCWVQDVIFSFCSEWLLNTATHRPVICTHLDVLLSRSKLSKWGYNQHSNMGHDLCSVWLMKCITDFIYIPALSRLMC